MSKVRILENDKLSLGNMPEFNITDAIFCVRNETLIIVICDNTDIRKQLARTYRVRGYKVKEYKRMPTKVYEYITIVYYDTLSRETQEQHNLSLIIEKYHQYQWFVIEHGNKPSNNNWSYGQFTVLVIDEGIPVVLNKAIAAHYPEISLSKSGELQTQGSGVGTLSAVTDYRQYIRL